MRLLLLFSTCVLLVLAPFPHSEAKAPESGTPSLLVVGVSKQFEDEKWKDSRVGFGIRQLIAEELFGAGSYRMVEEKAEIRDRIGEFAKLMWAMGAEGDFKERLAEFEKGIAADFVAWGCVESFTVPQQSVSVGPFNRVRQTTKVKVCVYVRDVRAGTVIGEVGEGKSRRTVKSAFFHFREDRKGEVNFDKTAVGHATKEAVEEAVKALKEKGHLP